MAQKHTYHWKHGWIPLTHSAAMEKAKGNKKLAAEYLDAVDAKHLPRERHITAGHRNGTVGLHDRKSGHTASMGADDAKHLHDTGRHITGIKSDGTVEHRGPEGPGGVSRVDAADIRQGDIIHQPSAMGGRTRRLRVDKAYSPKSDGDVNIDATDLDTGRTVEFTLQGSKQHDVERGKRR